MKKSLILAFVLSVFYACGVKDATLPKKQNVVIYTDFKLESDSSIFQKLKKEKNISIFVKPIFADTLLRFLKGKKHQATVDLFLLKDFDLMQQLSNEQVLYALRSNKLRSRLDYIYRSQFGKWYALSKTPLVFVYNASFLKADTITRYSELIKKEWQGKLALQDLKTATMTCFVQGIQHDLKNKSAKYLSNLMKQKQGSLLKNDEQVIDKIKRNEASLGIVQLSSFIRYQTKLNKSKDSLQTKLRVIFPNQRNRGAYQTISSMGIYRYARNPFQAKKVMEFLLSRSAQYAYAKNRYDFPILNGVNATYELARFGKYRGRFVRNINVKINK